VLIIYTGEGFGARWIALRGCLREKGIEELNRRLESRVRARKALCGGAEQGEAGDQFEGVGAAAHQVFECPTASELFADGAGDFFVAGAEERVAQVLAGFSQIAERIGAGGGGTAEAGELREDVPNPVAGFSPPANLRQRCVVARRAAGLGFVKAGESVQRSEVGGRRSEVRERRLIVIGYWFKAMLTGRFGSRASPHTDVVIEISRGYLAADGDCFQCDSGS